MPSMHPTSAAEDALQPMSGAEQGCLFLQMSIVYKAINSYSFAEAVHHQH